MSYTDVTKIGCMFNATQKICFSRRFFTTLMELDKCPWFAETNQPNEVKYAFIMKALLGEDIPLKFDEKGVIQLCSREECREYLSAYQDKFDALEAWRKAKFGK